MRVAPLERMKLPQAIGLAFLFCAFAQFMITPRYNDHLEMAVEFIFKLFVAIPLFFAVGYTARQEERRSADFASWIEQHKNHSFYEGVAAGTVATLNKGDFSIHAEILMGSERKDGSSIIVQSGTDHHLACASLARIGLLEQTDPPEVIQQFLPTAISYVMQEDEMDAYKT